MNRDGNRNYLSPHLLSEGNLTQPELEDTIMDILKGSRIPLAARDMRKIMLETMGKSISNQRIAHVIDARLHGINSRFRGNNGNHYKEYWI